MFQKQIFYDAEHESRITVHPANQIFMYAPRTRLSGGSSIVVQQRTHLSNIQFLYVLKSVIISSY